MCGSDGGGGGGGDGGGGGGGGGDCDGDGDERAARNSASLMTSTGARARAHDCRTKKKRERDLDVLREQALARSLAHAHAAAAARAPKLHTIRWAPVERCEPTAAVAAAVVAGRRCVGAQQAKHGGELSAVACLFSVRTFWQAKFFFALIVSAANKKVHTRARLAYTSGERRRAASSVQGATAIGVRHRQIFCADRSKLPFFVCNRAFASTSKTHVIDVAVDEDASGGADAVVCVVGGRKSRAKRGHRARNNEGGGVEGRRPRSGGSGDGNKTRRLLRIGLDRRFGCGGGGGGGGGGVNADAMEARRERGFRVAARPRRRIVGGRLMQNGERQRRRIGGECAIENDAVAMRLLLCRRRRAFTAKKLVEWRQIKTLASVLHCTSQKRRRRRRLLASKRLTIAVECDAACSRSR